uniref:Uncharacterized protein n=1 Tax=Vitis vinifera TaxID=29760 RepID=A5C7S1_VITVI|nr:hypothetical protein VITISV_014672 [Vitis vinifera]
MVQKMKHGRPSKYWVLTNRSTGDCTLGTTLTDLRYYLRSGLVSFSVLDIKPINQLLLPGRGPVENELSWTRICESKTHLEVRVSVFGYSLSPPKLHFVFPKLSWTPMAPRRVERRILTPSWSFGFASYDLAGGVISSTVNDRGHDPLVFSTMRSLVTKDREHELLFHDEFEMRQCGDDGG